MPFASAVSPEGTQPGGSGEGRGPKVGKPQRSCQTSPVMEENGAGVGLTGWGAEVGGWACVAAGIIGAVGVEKGTLHERDARIRINRALKKAFCIEKVSLS